jgi:predicted aspartyl protease
VTLEAIVDTGAAFTTAPASILDRLGVQSHRTARFQLANGQRVEWRLGRVTAALDGVEDIILCVFGSEGAPALIGAHTLEAFLLGVDPIEQRLVPKDGWMVGFL